MELMEKINRVTVGEDVNVKKFTISASAKAFKILSSGLYSDKILAIVRELSTNAYDSHISAGCADNPFDVHLPLHNNTKFYVRDYGTGLSQEKMEEIYTTYFMSDKTGSNEYVGCLGLGSKSPFAYVDSFTVTSFYNGTKYIYSAFIDANGGPSLGFLGELQTNEPDGLKVEFDVNKDDCSKFSAAAQKVYRWFGVLPNFVGNQTTITRVELDKDLPHTDRWYFIGGRESYAVMGNVAYPLNKIPVSTFNNQQTQLLNCGVCIKFDIGDLDIEASREGVSFDKRTIHNISRKFNEILASLQKELQSKVGCAKNTYEAAIEYIKLKSTMNSIFGIVDIKYNNLPVPVSFTLEFHSQNLPVNEKDIALTLCKLNYNNKTKMSDDYSIDVTRSHIIFIDDLARGGTVRIRNYALLNRDKYIYVISPDTQKVMFKKLLDKMGVDENYFPKTSSLPKPVYSRKTAGKGDKGDVLRFEYSGRKESSWVEFDGEYSVSKDERVIYVPIANYQTTNKLGAVVDVQFLNKMINTYNSLTKETLVVYGIRKAKVEKLTKNSDTFVSLLDYIAENAPDTQEIVNFNYGFVSTRQNHEYTLFYRSLMDFYNKNCQKNTNKKLENILNSVDFVVKKYYNSQSGYENCTQLFYFAGLPMASPQITIVDKEIEDALKPIKNIASPLTKLGINNYDSDVKLETLQYILSKI